MEKVGFFTAVSFRDQPESHTQSLIKIVDRYFYFGGRKACVIPGRTQNGSEGTEPIQSDPPSFLTTALKVISYFTIVIPTIMLITKVVLRYVYDFHIIDRSQKQPETNPLPTTHTTTQSSQPLSSTSDSQNIDSRDLQKEFSSLMSNYSLTIRLVTNRPENKVYFDNAYQKLQTFVQTHPEFASQLPKKFQVQGDGKTGAGATIDAFGSNLWETGKSAYERKFD